MTIEEQLENIGFVNDGVTKDPFNGDFNTFNKRIDNNHIIPWHDYLNVKVVLMDGRFIEIQINHVSSYSNGCKTVYRGKWEDIKFFEKILKSCISYYG